MELKKAFPDVHIVGPRKEKAKTPGVEKIPGIDRKVDDGDSVFVGDVELKVMDVPGHTLGHCAYHVPSAKSAFVGDCVFAAGCGRVFEGTHEQMFASITKNHTTLISNSDSLWSLSILPHHNPTPSSQHHLFVKARF